MPRGIEQVASLLKQRIGARTGAALEVAVMNDKRYVLCIVNVIDEIEKLGLLGRSVLLIANQREMKPCGRDRRSQQGDEDTRRKNTNERSLVHIFLQEEKKVLAGVFLCKGVVAERERS